MKSRSAIGALGVVAIMLCGFNCCPAQSLSGFPSHWQSSCLLGDWCWGDVRDDITAGHKCAPGAVRDSFSVASVGQGGHCEGKWLVRDDPFDCRVSVHLGKGFFEPRLDCKIDIKERPSKNKDGKCPCHNGQVNQPDGTCACPAGWAQGDPNCVPPHKICADGTYVRPDMPCLKTCPGGSRIPEGQNCPLTCGGGIVSAAAKYFSFLTTENDSGCGGIFQYLANSEDEAQGCLGRDRKSRASQLCNYTVLLETNPDFSVDVVAADEDSAKTCAQWQRCSNCSPSIISTANCVGR